MAQKAFMADAGIRLGEWSIVELGNGDLQVSNMHTISGSQKMFRVDKGLRIGDWRMTVNNDGDMLLSETAITGSQRPFIADGGVKIGAWTLHPTEDGDLYAEKNAVMVNYTLSCNYSAVNEGGSVIISLATTGVSAGTSVPYTISGVSSADIDNASLTGNFVVGTTDSVTLNVTADSTTEGTETLQLALDNGNSSKSVTINDTSTTPATQDASDFNWSVATTIDIASPVTYGTLASGATDYGVHSSNYDDGAYQAQLEEGDTMTWTATTNAPDGIQVYYTCVSTYYGSYQSGGDPNWNDVSGNPSTSGWLTVSNGQVSATITAIDDSVTEDGEIRQVWLMKQAGDYSNILAESQWFHIADPSQTWTAPSSGETFTGGEYYSDSGSSQTQWYTAADSSTGNAQMRVRMNEGKDHDLRRNINYVLDNLSTGDTFYVGTTSGTSMTVTGNITKTQISGDYYDYFFDVSVAPASTTYLYEYTVVA
jgi:hypothetical protein